MGSHCGGKSVRVGEESKKSKVAVSVVGDRSGDVLFQKVLYEFISKDAFYQAIRFLPNKSSL